MRFSTSLESPNQKLGSPCMAIAQSLIELRPPSTAEQEPSPHGCGRESEGHFSWTVKSGIHKGSNPCSQRCENTQHTKIFMPRSEASSRIAGKWVWLWCWSDPQRAAWHLAPHISWVRTERFWP